MNENVKFQVLTVASMKITVFIALTIEAESTSETSVNFYQTTRRNIPKDSHLQELKRSILTLCVLYLRKTGKFCAILN
jgi:hypothetical protein